MILSSVNEEMQKLNLDTVPPEKLRQALGSYIEYLLKNKDLPQYHYGKNDVEQVDGLHLPLYFKNLDFSGEFSFIYFFKN